MLLHGGGPVKRLSCGLPPGDTEPEQPSPWAHVNIESKARWLMISDDLPRFDSWPDASQLQELMRQHPDSWLPEQLLTSAA